MRAVRGLLAILVVAGCLLSQSAYAWWDTHIMYIDEPPRVLFVNAQDAQLSDGARVVDDTPRYEQAPGDGKAVELKPGVGTLTWTVDLQPSTYRLFAIARVPAATPWEHDTPEWPMFARCRVTDPAGKLLGDWTLPINYLDTHYDVARFSFPAHTAGRYTLEFSITGESKAALVVDRLDLRDELGNTFKKGFKTGRYLHGDDDVARLRTLFYEDVLAISGAKTHEEFRAMLADEEALKKIGAELQASSKGVIDTWGGDGASTRLIRQLANGPVKLGQEPPLAADAWDRQAARFTADWGTGCEKWNTTFTATRTIDPGVKLNSELYLKTGDPEIALRYALLLIGIADIYPAMDWSTQIWDDAYGPGEKRSLRFTYTNGRFGKIQYAMWGTDYPMQFAQVYDAVFPFIQAHGDHLAKIVNKKIPSIQNGDDVIAFLDTRLLQYVGDCVNRGRIRSMQGGSDTVLVVATVTQGPNPAGNRMANWLYSRIYWDMTEDGGIQDQAISGRNRDGSAIIGSVGYSQAAGEVLIKASTLMQRFVAHGGDPRFDLSDPARFPSVLAGAFFPLDSRVAGGYQPLIGDWGRSYNAPLYSDIGKYGDFHRFAFRRTGDPRMAWLLKHAVGRTIETDAEWARVEQAAAGQRDPQLSSRSRNLEGFGLAILEAGVEHDDFTKKRALTMRHGVAKGHAHSDSLSLEYYAHGIRAVPDAGNRGGAPHPGDMRAHLGVTVDGTPMRNTGEANVSGTAWTTAFLPAAGSQYVAGSARFGFNPAVTRYDRQAILIDVAGSDDSYVFDVLRVAGGQEHVWSTHGPASDDTDVATYNFAVAAATGPNAERILDGHQAPQTGVLGDIAQATWPLGKTAADAMLRDAAKTANPGFKTRVTLLGHGGATAYLGHSDPQAKGLEESQWLTTIRFMHVRATGEDGLATVWPQLIESYGEKPLIARTEVLQALPQDATASAPVAARVHVANGQQDLLIADGQGDRVVTVGETSMTGQFAHVSTDAKGLRLAHLVGGTHLDHPDVTIEAQSARLQTRITAVDYVKRQITLETPLPPTVKPGSELLINAPEHPQVFHIEKIEGTVVTLTLSPILYQSEIMTINEDDGTIICAMNPSLLLADPTYYDGVTAVSESSKTAWRVKTVQPKYIFMYLQEPVLDWAETYTIESFPDSDGDGKRTLTLHNWGGGDGSPEIAELVLEVASFNEERQVAFFELPENPDVIAGNGWQWAASRMTPDGGRWMFDESGKRWMPNWPGKRNVIVLDGPVSEADLADADKDGRRVLRLYHFGVNDSVSLTTDVLISRQDDGSYTIDGSSPATVTVRHADGKTTTLNQ